MPIGQIYILEGRTAEQKRAVIEKVTQALVEALDAPKDSVRILIHDVPKDSWGIGGHPVSVLRQNVRLVSGSTSDSDAQDK